MAIYFLGNTNYYKFNSNESNIVKVNTDLKRSISPKNFFEGINELISVNFTSDFKTNEIESTAGIFMNSKSLTDIYISLLDLKNNKDMSSMFRSCNSLKNIKFENINKINSFFLLRIIKKFKLI